MVPRLSCIRIGEYSKAASVSSADGLSQPPARFDADLFRKPASVRPTDAGYRVVANDIGLIDRMMKRFLRSLGALGGAFGMLLREVIDLTGNWSFDPVPMRFRRHFWGGGNRGQLLPCNSKSVRMASQFT